MMMMSSGFLLRNFSARCLSSAPSIFAPLHFIVCL